MKHIRKQFVNNLTDLHFISNSNSPCPIYFAFMLSIVSLLLHCPLSSGVSKLCLLHADRSGFAAGCWVTVSERCGRLSSGNTLSTSRNLFVDLTRVILTEVKWMHHLPSGSDSPLDWRHPQHTQYIPVMLLVSMILNFHCNAFTR